MTGSRARELPWWHALLLTLIMILAMRGAFFGAAAIRAAAHSQSLAEAVAAASRDLLTVGLAQAIGVGLAVFIGVRWIAPEARLRDTLRIAPVSPAIVVLALVTGLALQFPLTEIANILADVSPGVFRLPPEQQHELYRRMAPGTIGGTMIVVLSVAVIAPASEEVFFRGLLLPGVRARHGALLAIVVTSLLFGFSHLTPRAMIYGAVAGVILGIVANRTQSTVPAIAMHAAINAVPILLPESILPIPGFNIVGERVYHLPLPWLLGGLVVAAAGIFGITRLTESEEDG